MFSLKSRSILCSADSWSGCTPGPKTKLYKLHHFFMHCSGANYNIEVQEGLDGMFTAHADNTADQHDALPSTSGKTLEACLNEIIAKIEARGATS